MFMVETLDKEIFDEQDGVGWNVELDIAITFAWMYILSYVAI